MNEEKDRTFLYLVVVTFLIILGLGAYFLFFKDEVVTKQDDVQVTNTYESDTDISEATFTSYEVLKRDASLSTFYSLLDTAAIRGELDTYDSGITIFAPTNDSFGEDVDSLLLPENAEDLSLFVKSHVFSSTYTLENLHEKVGDTIIPLQGASVDVTTSNGAIILNDVIVLNSGEVTTNGLVYTVRGILE